MASNIQEKGYEKRFDELALPGDELQTPVKKRLEKLLRHLNMTRDELALPGDELQIPVEERLETLLRHFDMTWDNLVLFGQDHLDSDRSALRSFPWREILRKLRKRQKKSKKHIHGRMTYTVYQTHSRIKTPKRSVSSCPGRRHSRPVGSCWAGKGACLQDFYSNNPETRGRGSQ